MTYQIGDTVVTTESCEYSEFPAGTKGVISDILPEICPYRYIVDFPGPVGKATPLESSEFILAAI